MAIAALPFKLCSRSFFSAPDLILSSSSLSVSVSTRLTKKLEVDGVASFAKSFDSLIAVVEKRRQETLKAGKPVAAKAVRKARKQASAKKTARRPAKKAARKKPKKPKQAMKSAAKGKARRAKASRKPTVRRARKIGSRRVNRRAARRK